jgi:hypothetical protein
MIRFDMHPKGPKVLVLGKQGGIILVLSSKEKGNMQLITLMISFG